MVEVPGSEVIGGDPRADKSYKVKVYDFRRPDKLSLEQMRTISIMHETMSRLFVASLSALLRTEAKVHVSTIDQITYEEFIREVEKSAVLNIVNMDPLRGACVIHMTNSIGYAIIERVHGATRLHAEPNRDFSELEMSSMETVMIRLLGCFREAWSMVTSVRPRLGQIETNPEFCQMLPPTDMVVIVTFEVKIGEVESEMHIVYPYVAIEPISHLLSMIHIYSPARKAPGTGAAGVHVGDIESEITVAVDAPPLSIGELANLKPGDLVPLPSFGEGNGYLLLNRTPVDVLRWESPEEALAGNYLLVSEDASAPSLGDEEAVDEQPAAAPDPVESFKIFAKEIADQLSTGLRTITAKLDEIAGRQDDLTDQIAYSGVSETEPATRESQEPFSYITVDDVQWFVPLFGSEHPQTIAMIISYLEPRVSALIFEELPESARTEIAERISTTGRIAPEILKGLDRTVKQRFDTYIQSEFTRPGGIDRLVEILNVSSRKVEVGIVESFERSNPEMAEEVKKRMFVFDDIVLLDRKAMALVIEETDESDIAIALRGVDQRVKNHILEGGGPEFVNRVTKAMEEIGPVRLSDVERAQMRVISVIRQLEQQGMLHIARADEQIV